MRQGQRKTPQTLEAVINARNRAMNATGPADKAQAENMLSGALKSLFALSEAYPQFGESLQIAGPRSPAGVTWHLDGGSSARRPGAFLVRDGWD